MAVLGEEVGRAYISVNADTTQFKEDLQRLRVTSRNLFRTLGKEAGKAFQRAFEREIRGVSLRSLTTRVRSEVQRMVRTIGTDLRIIGAVIQDRLVAPINRGMTRAVNQVIVSVGRAKDAVLGFGSDVGSVLGGQLGDQLLRVQVLVDRISPSLRGLKNSLLDTAVGMREMLAPGLWDRFLDSLQLFVVHMGVSGRRAAEEFQRGFNRVWNSELMVSVREALRDLGVVLREGTQVLFRDLRSYFTLGFQMTGDSVVDGTKRIGRAFQSMWDNITMGSKKGAKDNKDSIEEFAVGIEKATKKMADSVETHTRSSTRSTTKFVGRLKGSRNDALNAVGAIGGAFESLVSGAITGGFKILGGLTSKLGGSLLNIGEGAGFLQGPLNLIGAAMVRVGVGMSAASATGIGLVIVLATLVASFFAVGAAVAILSTLLSMLTGIVVALASSLAFAAAGALLPLGIYALAAAAGIGALILAFQGLDDEQKKAFDPLKDTVKELQKVVRDKLFANLAEQIDGLNGILKESVAPLLIGAAGALSSVIDYMIMAFERPAVKAALAVLSETLPNVLKDLGTAFVDFTTGMLGFFSAIAPDVEAIAQDIADAAWEFSQWANSKAGQDAIKDFFAKAKESADILWDVILNVGDALKTLFQEGKDGGDSMIQKIADIIGKFAEWASSEEGREQIKQWFTDAKDIAGKLWDVIVSVSESIADLDTPENREALKTLIGWITNVFDAINKVAQVFKDLPQIIENVKKFTFAIPGVGTVLAGLNSIIEAIKWIANHMPGPTTKSFVDNRPGSSGVGGSQVPMKSGGILNSPTHVYAGEAGREMVVPLVRPLSQVDPSVRAVSAFARGLDSSTFNGGNTNPGKVINISDGAIRLSVPTDDPEQAANAVLDRLVARWK